MSSKKDDDTITSFGKKEYICKQMNIVRFA